MTTQDFCIDCGNPATHELFTLPFCDECNDQSKEVEPSRLTWAIVSDNKISWIHELDYAQTCDDASGRY